MDFRVTFRMSKTRFVNSMGERESPRQSRGYPCALTSSGGRHTECGSYFDRDENLLNNMEVTTRQATWTIPKPDVAPVREKSRA